jgi:beta-lactamase class A
VHIIKRLAKRPAAAGLAAVLILLGLAASPGGGFSPAYFEKGPAAYQQQAERSALLPNSSPLAGLKEELEREIRGSGMEVRLCLYDYRSGAQIDIEGRKPLYPASMIKTLLLLAALEQVEQGRLSLSGTHTLSEADKYAGSTFVSGSGILQFVGAGTVYTLEELLSLMVGASDNIATNILFDLVGAGPLSAMAQRLGLENTAFTRKMYDLGSAAPSNVSTACELTRMLVALENREAAGDDLSRKGIAMMLKTDDKGRIGRLVRGKAAVANKVGTVSGVVGDMALLYFPGRPPAALTVAVVDPPDQEEAARLIGKLAALIVDCLQ